MTCFRWIPVYVCAYATGLFLLAGCGQSGPKRVSVSGQVTLDGKPFSGGVLSFAPDISKGNKYNLAAIGPVQNGKYNLRTLAIKGSESGPGVPLGWYRVYLDNTLSGENLKIAPRFTDANLSPIVIEVVENPAPGVYDIKFTSK